MRRKFVKSLSLSLAAVMLLCGGCGDTSDAGNTAPGTEQGSVTQQPDGEVEPTKAAEVTPTEAVTPTEEPVATPTEAVSPTEDPAVTPTESVSPTAEPTESESPAGQAQEDICLSPRQKLAPGEHFILYQERDWTREDCDRVIHIYDEDWNCCATFYNVNTAVKGLTAARCIALESYDEWGKLQTQLWDMKKHEYIEPEDETMAVKLLDPQKGYVLFYEKNDITGTYGRVADCDGNVLLEDNFDWGEMYRPYRTRDYYVINYRRNGVRPYAAMVQEIYDLDMQLKTILYLNEADIPPVSERKEGVAYELVEGGYVMSTDGDVLLNTKRFHEKFGEGSVEISTEDGANDKQKIYSELYSVQVNDETWYVDAALNAIIKEGETQVTILDKEKTDVFYYVADIWGVDSEEGGYIRTTYFAADGSPLVMQATGEEPWKIDVNGNESCMMCGNVGDSLKLEEVFPAENRSVHYSFDETTKKYGLKEYMDEGYYMLVVHYAEYSGMGQKTEVVVCKGEQVEKVSAEDYISLIQCTDEASGEKEETWYLELDNGDELGRRLIYTYAILQDGRVTFTTPEAGELMSCSGGYIQVNCGDDTYVYDYDGNRIIKAGNR